MKIEFFIILDDIFYEQKNYITYIIYNDYKLIYKIWILTFLSFFYLIYEVKMFIWKNINLNYPWQWNFKKPLIKLIKQK